MKSILQDQMQEGKIKILNKVYLMKLYKKDYMFEDNLSDFGKADGGRIGTSAGRRFI